MRSLWTNPPVRYALIIVLLVLFGLLTRQLLEVIFGSDLLFTALVVVLSVVGAVLLIRAYRRSSNS
ncbi:MAG: hypothetical protein AVDCRST_MAG03-2292 [uncultured Rubrobacteraceae bacterium]|uniref:Uncharacterized protein n=1 Tax=uncultured Rubrobacteraceae bacterium TaxID=349277 RepID=A0A6J4PJT0_9ACTN|nr:MAG: hypothetical protein AVDCRST_MAG03-2292 [uncultured Rubrobacteraceae bacterium]